MTIEQHELQIQEKADGKIVFQASQFRGQFVEPQTTQRIYSLIPQVLNDMQNNNDNDEVTEKVKRVAKGDDKAMDEVAPKRTFALIALAYPLVLIATIALLFLFWKLLEA